MTYWMRVAILATLFAAVTFGGLYYLSQQNDNSSTKTADKAVPAKSSPAEQAGGGRRGGGRPPALVVAQPVVGALINDRLKAVGSGRAKASVSVVPLSGGLLGEVLVSSGQTVVKDTILAQLDKEEQIIARDRAASTVENIALDEARAAELFRSRTTSEAELIRIRAELADAKLVLRDTELSLRRRDIRAPIGGIVGLFGVDEGNYVTTQTEIVTIDDRSTIVLEFWVPERFSDQVVIGQSIEASSQANPGRVHTGTISGIGSRVETDSRTLPVQAELNNDDDRLRPGMAFNISLNFTGQTHPAVDPLAIQWDSKGSFVWELVGEKVQRVPVKIIQRNPESVLVAGDLIVGSNVVTEGLMSLRPGATVRVQGQGQGQGQNIQASQKPGKQGGKQRDKKGNGESPANSDNNTKDKGTNDKSTQDKNSKAKSAKDKSASDQSSRAKSTKHKKA